MPSGQPQNYNCIKIDSFQVLAQQQQQHQQHQHQNWIHLIRSTFSSLVNHFRLMFAHFYLEQDASVTVVVVVAVVAVVVIAINLIRNIPTIKVTVNKNAKYYRLCTLFRYTKDELE
jgi:hypothetical protein